MLSERYGNRLQGLLLKREDWHPYPTVHEPDAWAVLPESIRSSFLSQGKDALSFDWPTLPATVFMEFKREGDRSRYQDIRNDRRGALRDLVLAECVEGKGRFLDAIMNGIWATCEETYWGVPAHLYMQKEGPGLPDVQDVTVDLFAAETLNLLAWTWYLLGDRLDGASPLIRPRIVFEAQRRALGPCLERDDFWWMGFSNHPYYNEPRVNNWNPWICSNWLTAVLLLEEDGNRRVAAVQKILRCLDMFINSYHSDGGCDEGPGYWGRAAASLFDNLELLHSATKGAVDVYTEPLIRNMGQFIYRAQIADHYFVNFADASAIVTPSASLTFRYGKAIGDLGMMALGAWAAKEQNLAKDGPGDSLGRQLPALFTLKELLETPPSQPLPRDVWLNGIQFFAARDQAGSSSGFYVAAKGGHNAESHNHNDVGNVIVYIDGKPVLVDAGVETYTAKTFGPNRYDLWTMQSAFHTLPIVNGGQQLPGKQFAAKGVLYEAGDLRAELNMDISGAYPPEAGIKSWDRMVALLRGEEVIIYDRFALRSLMGPITMHMMTPCDVDIQAGKMILKATAFGRNRMSGSATVHFETNVFDVHVERIEITDSRLGGVWGTHLHRIVFTAKDSGLQGAWRFRVTR